MRIVNPLLIKTFTAEATITKYMVVVEGTADGQANAPSGANVQSLGIAMHAAAAGDSVDVVLFGAYIGVANGAIARGAHVAISGTDGRLASITIGSTTASLRLVGKALSAASSAGDQFSILLSASNFIEV